VSGALAKYTKISFDSNILNMFPTYNVEPGGAFLRTTPGAYPGTNGECRRSIRLNALREAMDDYRALQLYEARYGKDAAKALILEGTDGKFSFLEYPNDAQYLIDLREKIAKALDC